MLHAIGITKIRNLPRLQTFINSNNGVRTADGFNQEAKTRPQGEITRKSIKNNGFTLLLALKSFQYG